MKLIAKLSEIWKDVDYAFLIHNGNELKFSQIAAENPVDLSQVKPGDVVAIIGDFNPSSILTLLRLIDLGAIVVPLTVETAQQHDYFFEQAQVDVIIDGDAVRRRAHQDSHALIDALRRDQHAGLILFSTGTTGRPKAILHDLTLFLKRFETPRPTSRTINFLLFDHIGGINTLLHTLFNKGVVVAPQARTVHSVLETCRAFDVEVLPTTPTFLRMMLMSGAVPDMVPPCLKLITYGTERMDQPTLDALCALLPQVDFRQTFGMSELGIVRVKSEARDSLFMKVGGEGVETRVVDDVLQIRSRSRMLGYLNAPSPFDADGWYDTKDIVEVKDGYYKVVGRTSEVINVGGLKFMASEVERVALDYPGVSLVKAYARQNPITGQHVELTVQPADGALEKDALAAFLKDKLQAHMVPKRIRLESVSVGHRFKRA
ncbi:class I adenylate-forming enzyme family protein [Cupriavidus respiraculi]|uniref:Fatty-acid--CoA ligase FadD10 n=1 Tax=Cupriavidus respiraculi TaxID=195930 RepID=A0ABN7Y5J8_9BURK|nr:fatty acid--CoA ligase family protein [Cupriavidus respiraculi]CAG9168613.1 Putative fatty-acid--CoA ligase FadD10 [Cupriavidus respiraculi]